MTTASQILIYKNTEGTIKLDVQLQEDTVWLTQEQKTPNFYNLDVIIMVALCENVIDITIRH